MKRIKSIESLMDAWRDTPRLVVAFNVGYGGLWRKILPQVNKLENEFGDKIQIVIVDIRKMKVIGLMLNLRGLPSMYFVKHGRIQKTVSGLCKYESLSKYAKSLMQ